MAVGPRWVVVWILACAGPAASGWQVEQGRDPVERDVRCLLRSDAVTTPDGYGETPVILWLDGRRLVASAESHVDATFADIRLTVDAEPSLHVDRIARDILLLFEQSYAALVRRFKAGREARLEVRFWPTWPATRSFTVIFSLRGFTKAHVELTKCLGARAETQTQP